MKIKKGIPLIDQHDKNGFYGGKFGGNYVAETLKKPIDDLTKLFEKCRKDKNFIKERDNLYENYVGKPTRFIKLQNLTDHLMQMVVLIKSTTLLLMLCFVRNQKKNICALILVLVITEKCFLWLQKNLV